MTWRCKRDNLVLQAALGHRVLPQHSKRKGTETILKPSEVGEMSEMEIANSVHPLVIYRAFVQTQSLKETPLNNCAIYRNTAKQSGCGEPLSCAWECLLGIPSLGTSPGCASYLGELEQSNVLLPTSVSHCIIVITKGI